MQIQAAVLRHTHGDFSIETVDLDTPQADEVRVQVVATGLCHTDLTVRDGVFPFPATPNILGHEGAGIVTAVGAAVRDIEVGDHVVMSFAFCGSCPRCAEGMPSYCDNALRLSVRGKRPDGSCTHRQQGKAINACFFGQSSFATQALVNARQLVKVPRDMPLELLGPLGCGIQTGAGTILNSLKPEPGSAAAIFGTGAVGLSAIMAARIAGCSKIIAVDVQPARLVLAQELGATHIVDSRELDAVARIHEITGGGADVVVEATGLPAVVAQSIRSSRRLGQVALLGVGKVDAPLPITLGDLMTGTTIRYVMVGDSLPRRFIPELIEFYRQGRFPFDRLIRFYELDAINDAVRDAAAGVAIKPVIRMPRAHKP
jgi:aryl-alcohol dehydrogenase